jgi:sterol desaturase/sphingolipid hydroxylase (fatty acid hydroxylase superfamily)
MIDRLLRLLRSHGPIRPGRGLLSGLVGLGLALGSLLGVLAFHFPQHLTTPDLRQVYEVDWLRRLLVGAIAVAGGIALANTLFGRMRWLSGLTFVLVGVALLLGGHRVEIDGEFKPGTPYVGLDWFVLDLLGSTLVFVFLEKLAPLRPDQPVFREAWQTDLQHFMVNHLLVGFVLLAVNALVHHGIGWAVHGDLQDAVRALPFWLALPLVVLVADLAQYVTHRAFHEVPWLWRFHAVHHSVKTMDWLAGSRLHLVDVIVVRAAVLAPIVWLGFDKAVVDAYIVFAGTQAVFNHANVRWRFGPLRHVLVTPAFHHWHHAQDDEAIDRNYAAHLAFLDRLFGTAVKSEREWPLRYGVVGDGVPDGWWAQTVYPLRPPRG